MTSSHPFLSPRILIAVILLVQLSTSRVVNAFIPRPNAFTISREHFHTSSVISSTSTEETSQTTNTAEIDPKEAVKVFGRLAEKYIMLDSSGGMCCYSACTDCEFRDPNGGYIMADQSASRPKWIPTYEHRLFESSGKEHSSKWSNELFGKSVVLTKEEFVASIQNDLSYAPCLGGE
mmetsp:Transcript_54511/g.80916  ORF Transcript_54511/g.80916 Transcript_54511/m.80916 type:complete len:177 (+) Transcript_54511:116-646(+)